jgi:two-component system response regulator protein BraR/BceR
MYKILIVEDDATIAYLIKENLIRWDYEAVCVTDFRNITAAVAEHKPHLILLDIMLPYFNGFFWCGEIRKISKTPIMFISSASDNMNIIMAMNMGGDDFIAKPFDMNVLVAKIQALMRRSYSMGGQADVLAHKGALLNLSDATLVYQGSKIELTKNDFRILRLLMENIGRVVSRTEIMEALWQSDSFIDDNTLTVNITRLRKKLEDAGLSDFIVTKKGIGYLVE